MTIKEVCFNCKFFKDSDNVDDDIGECRRYPRSRNDSYGMCIFPEASRKDWCGEWRLNLAKTIEDEKTSMAEVKKKVATVLHPGWSVNKLQEVDWILATFYLKGETFGDVVAQSKAKKAVGLEIFDLESWRWLQRGISEESWKLFTIALDFFQKHPQNKMVDFNSEFWKDSPDICRAIIALCQQDEETLKSLGMTLGGEAPLMPILEGQVSVNVLAPVFRGYWNMRLRLIPGSHFEAHLPTGILGVAVSRLDPLFLLARGAWIVGRHA